MPSNNSLTKFGKTRNYEILSGLEKFHYLTTNQIAELYFQKDSDNNTGISNPLQRTQKTTEVMKKLYKQGFINRYRFPPEPYVFYSKSTKYTTHIGHYLTIASCWIILNKLIPLDTTLTCEVEYKQDNIITDLFIHKITKNQFRHDEKYYYLEIENKSTADILEKIKQYETLAWIKQMNNEPIGILNIIFAGNIPKKITNTQFNFPVNLISFNNLEVSWKW